MFNSHIVYKVLFQKLWILYVIIYKTSYWRSVYTVQPRGSLSFLAAMNNYNHTVLSVL